MIQLENVVNVRDLGGYKTYDGKYTKHKVFYRSGNTDRSSEDDIRKLIEIYNVKTVIDLRNTEEIKKSSDKFAEVSKVNYINTPIEYYGCLEEFKSTDRGLSVLYDYILNKKKQVLKNVFDTIASVKEGSILFHCTLGRDRTAMVAMLLLGLVGVSRKDIIQNYTATYDLIKDLDIIKRDLVIYGKRKTITLPEYIESAIDLIENNYNTFENYLRDCNISEENLKKIKNKFIH
ncbi:MAG: tyrosine-protein phosphatase [Clostridia bacterium]|nr:tyrosine-protein phosphatase [Clostridia bacterium]